tara:strand:- start:7867 stop:8832 length:966 start_codon:yes stop_codon:yes gene_type:complete
MSDKFNKEPNFHNLTPNQKSQNDEFIAYRELFVLLWRGKFWVSGITFIAVFISLMIALWLPNIYRSEALLVAESGNSSTLSSLASQYSGLANLAGVSLPTSNDSNDKDIGIAKLRSRQFITNFIEKHNILPELMAEKYFDWSSGEVHLDAKVYDEENNIWTRKASAPFTSRPSPLESYEEFIEILSVSEDRESGFISISIDHLSPIIAQQWVSWLVNDLNTEMMLEKTSETKQSIEFLTEQMNNTQIVELKQVFSSLMEEQTKILMLANSRSEYLFKTIDPAVIPELKAKPSRALILILGAFIGGLLSVLCIFILQHFKKL